MSLRDYVICHNVMFHMTRRDLFKQIHVICCNILILIEMKYVMRKDTPHDT